MCFWLGYPKSLTFPFLILSCRPGLEIWKTMAQLTMQWSLVENQQQTEPLKYDYSISQSNWNYTNEVGQML